MIKPKKLRSLMRWKVRVSITRRKRCASGFKVTGPDGKIHECPTRREALANLSARMKCYEVAPWKIEVNL